MKTNPITTLINSRTLDGIKVLFLYPNERGMSTVPPSIALLSTLLKNNGHRTNLFDTTFYDFDDEYGIGDADQMNADALNVRPIQIDDDNKVDFIYADRDPKEDLKNLVCEYQPELIAVSVTETTFHRGRLLMQSITEFAIPNIWGGIFPTFAPDLCLTFQEVDMVCVGEGEIALVELANRIRDKKDYSNVTNCWIKVGGEIIKNAITKPVNIDELPTITDMGLFEDKRFYRPMGGKVRRLLPVETHRGCPYTCSFCNSPSQNRLYGAGSFFRRKSINLIKEEITNHINEWKVEYIYFWADTFLAWPNKQFEEFIEMYSDIKLPFWCQTRIETINEYKLTKLKSVGLDRITFGMEHGNEQYRRDLIKRDYSNADAIRLMQIPKDIGITFSVNNIVGFPDETRDLAFDTIELNRQFESDNLSCSIFVPFHGTELHDYAVERGYLESNFISGVSNSNESVLNMPQWSKENISRLRGVFAMYVKFPKNRWPEIEQAEHDLDLRDKLSQEFIELCWDNPRAQIENDLPDIAYL